MQFGWTKTIAVLAVSNFAVAVAFHTSRTLDKAIAGAFLYLIVLIPVGLFMDIRAWLKWRKRGRSEMALPPVAQPQQRQLSES